MFEALTNLATNLKSTESAPTCSCELPSLFRAAFRDHQGCTTRRDHVCAKYVKDQTFSTSTPAVRDLVHLSHVAYSAQSLWVRNAMLGVKRLRELGAWLTEEVGGGGKLVVALYRPWFVWSNAFANVCTRIALRVWFGDAPPTDASCAVEELVRILGVAFAESAKALGLEEAASSARVAYEAEVRASRMDEELRLMETSPIASSTNTHEAHVLAQSGLDTQGALDVSVMASRLAKLCKEKGGEGGVPFDYVAATCGLVPIAPMEQDVSLTPLLHFMAGLGDVAVRQCLSSAMPLSVFRFAYGWTTPEQVRHSLLQAALRANVPMVPLEGGQPYYPIAWFDSLTARTSDEGQVETFTFVVGRDLVEALRAMTPFSHANRAPILPLPLARLERFVLDFPETTATSTFTMWAGEIARTVPDQRFLPPKAARLRVQRILACIPYMAHNFGLSGNDLSNDADWLQGLAVCIQRTDATAGPPSDAMMRGYAFGRMLLCVLRTYNRTDFNMVRTGMRVDARSARDRRRLAFAPHVLDLVEAVATGAALGSAPTLPFGGNNFTVADQLELQAFHGECLRVSKLQAVASTGETSANAALFRDMPGGALVPAPLTLMALLSLPATTLAGHGVDTRCFDAFVAAELGMGDAGDDLEHQDDDDNRSVASGVEEGGEKWQRNATEAVVATLFQQLNDQTEHPCMTLVGTPERTTAIIMATASMARGCHRGAARSLAEGMAQLLHHPGSAPRQAAAVGGLILSYGTREGTLVPEASTLPVAKMRGSRGVLDSMRGTVSPLAPRSHAATMVLRAGLLETAYQRQIALWRVVVAERQHAGAREGYRQRATSTKKAVEVHTKLQRALLAPSPPKATAAPPTLSMQWEKRTDGLVVPLIVDSNLRQCQGCSSTLPGTLLCRACKDARGAALAFHPFCFLSSLSAKGIVTSKGEGARLRIAKGCPDCGAEWPSEVRRLVDVADSTWWLAHPAHVYADSNEAQRGAIDTFFGGPPFSAEDLAVADEMRSFTVSLDAAGAEQLPLGMFLLTPKSAADAKKRASNQCREIPRNLRPRVPAQRGALL